MVAEIRELPYTERLKVLDLHSQYYRRRRGDAITVFKILKGMVRLDPSQFFTLSTNTTTRGHSLKIFKERSRLEVRKCFFSNRVVNDWNRLPHKQ